MVVAALQRKLTWQVVKSASLRTPQCDQHDYVDNHRGAQCFSTVYTVGGASDLMMKAFSNMAISPMDIAIMAFVIGLVMFFPEIALWLPGKLD